MPPETAFVDDFDTVIVAAQEALSADTRVCQRSAHRWIKVKTNIARNARIGARAASLAGDADQARRDFDKFTVTSPQKAARQILAAVEKDQRRALIGPDAKVIDLISRLPAGWYQRLLVRGAKRRR